MLLVSINICFRLLILIAISTSLLILYSVKQELNNFDISISITVNEELEKNYAYSSTEKFEKLKEKNPNIALLRKTFDLDI